MINNMLLQCWTLSKNTDTKCKLFFFITYEVTKLDLYAVTSNTMISHPTCCSAQEAMQRAMQNRPVVKP